MFGEDNMTTVIPKDTIKLFLYSHDNRNVAISTEVNFDANITVYLSEFKAFLLAAGFTWVDQVQVLGKCTGCGEPTVHSSED